MIDQNRIPNHVAIIMDGNGRWAEQRNLPRAMGHNAGMKAMKEIVKRASSLGIRHLTVYAFSTENWKRSTEEVNGIFKLIVTYVDNELRELHANNVRVHILGDYSRLPSDAVARLEKSLAVTETNTGMQFNIALNYGSRHEIVEAVRRISEAVRTGEFTSDQIDEETISRNLSTGMAGIPDPDLLIRTSGETRVSNFLLWQIAYSEIVYTQVLWPDFTPDIFEDAIIEYQKRDRRFGGRTK
jgi:undecaprenyl diphosphate synthase